MATNEDRAWHEAASVRCVEAPCCGFTFAAVHTNGDGSFSCPLCDDEPVAEQRGAERERARIVEYLRAVAKQFSLGDGAEVCDYTADACDMAADEIEGGAHLRKTGGSDA